MPTRSNAADRIGLSTVAESEGSQTGMMSNTDPTGSPKLLALPIAALLLILGAAAIGITLVESRRRSA